MSDMSHGKRIEDDFKVAFADEPGLTFVEYCELTRLSYPPKNSASYRAESDAALRSQSGRAARRSLAGGKAIIAVPNGDEPRLYPESQMTASLWYKSLNEIRVPNATRAVMMCFADIHKYRYAGGTESFAYLADLLEDLAKKLRKSG